MYEHINLSLFLIQKSLLKRWRIDNNLEYLLVFSQLTPVKPESHSHMYESTPSVHVPPFIHGLGEQKLGTTTKNKYIGHSLQNYAGHLQPHANSSTSLNYFINKSIFSTAIKQSFSN